LDIQAKLEAWSDLERELAVRQDKIQKLEEVSNVVGQMFDAGVIKQTPDGSFEAVVNPNERDQIQSKRKMEIQHLQEVNLGSQE